jgi:hypothetical protein
MHDEWDAFQSALTPWYKSPAIYTMVNKTCWNYACGRANQSRAIAKNAMPKMTARINSRIHALLLALFW